MKKIYLKLIIHNVEEYFIKTAFKYIKNYIKKDESNILFIDNNLMCNDIYYYETNDNEYPIYYDESLLNLDIYLKKIEKYIKNNYPEFGTHFTIKYNFLDK